VADAVFYQVFPDRFANGDPSNDPPGTAPWGSPPTREGFQGGDLAGVADHLDHIQALGATAIYLNPVFTAGTNHRYDTWDYFEVDPALGGTAALARLVDEAHGRGMRVILDGVFNHCGDGFGPFQDVVARGSRSAYRDWFGVRAWPVGRDPVNYMTCGGAPYLPKLNTRNPEVRELILHVGRYWVERLDIDGWRLDVPFKVPFDLWREFRDVVRRAKPDAYLVGEVWRDPVPWIVGDVFDGTTNYRLRDLVLDYVADEVLDAEDMGWELGQLLAACGPAATAMLNLLGSHDTARILTRLGGDVDRLRIALTLLCTLPGAPMVYYGDEVGLLGETDPDCRRAMPWDPASWDERVLGMHRRLIGLRHDHVACRRGGIEVLVAFEGVLAYRRAWEGDELVVVVNPRGSVADLAAPTGGPDRVWRELFTGVERQAAEGVLRLPQVSARSAAVFVPVG
jgi:glycosidase